jgi:hypothetical protein
MSTARDNAVKLPKDSTTEWSGILIQSQPDRNRCKNVLPIIGRRPLKTRAIIK